MKVWVVINWSTIDPGSVLLSVHQTREGAEAFVQAETDKRNGYRPHWDVEEREVIP